MPFQSIVALVAFATYLVTALPNPVAPEVLTATPVSEALAKRTTHVGEGTVYQQLGATGSCGEKNPDSAIIVALGDYWMNYEYEGPYCGRLIQVTNTGSSDNVGGAGNTVTVRVEDTCASCDENHIDFSVGAWNKLTNSAAWGTVDISWHFCNVDGQC